MISHKYKCIFIHIPKCAGTSIEESLGHLNNLVDRRGGQDHRTIRELKKPFISSNSFDSIENIREVYGTIKNQYFKTVSNPRNKFIVTKNQFDSYYKFTFIRNPWARAFSLYKNVMRDENHLKSFGITNQISFNEFLHRYAGKGMLRSQLYWIKNFNGSISLDYIGRFENLNKDFQYICNQINLSNIKLGHELRSSNEDYRNSYDEVSKKIIKETYNDEIKMFGFTFDS